MVNIFLSSPVNGWRQKHRPEKSQGHSGIDAADPVVGHRANAALNLATEKQVRYWDALIIAICAEHGVTQLYTEDAPSAPKLLGVKCVSTW